MSHHYNRAGEPISFEEWVRLFSPGPYKDMAKTDLPSGVHVSTIWLGLDHGDGAGPPVIFETMVFPEDENAERDQERYSTEAEALAGHAAMVAKWSKKP